MTQVQEIEDAIERLPPEQFRELAQWLRERDQQLWDDQGLATGSLLKWPEEK